MQSHYIIASIWHIVNLLASSPGAKWHCVFPPFGLSFIFPLCTQADKRNIWSFVWLLHLDLDLTALEKGTCMRRAAIVCSRVPLSFDIKRVKGHVTESLCSPTISVLLSPLQMFLCWLFYFPQVTLPASFAFSFFSLCCSYPPLLFLHTHTRARTHADTRTQTHTHRGKSICVRHSARERQRHWVNYPSFTAAEKNRW